MKRDLTNEEIEAIKADINRHLSIRDIAKKYHISFSVYSEIKNSAIDKTIQTETIRSEESSKKKTAKNDEPVSAKTIENNKTGKAGIVSEEHTNKEVKNDNIFDIRPPSKLKPKKFLFPRIGKKNTFLITYLGKFYFKFILPDFPKEMQDELAETIADAVIQFMERHKETKFEIIKGD